VYSPKAERTVWPGVCNGGLAVAGERDGFDVALVIVLVGSGIGIGDGCQILFPPPRSWRRDA
jgi:hypothetical protein